MTTKIDARSACFSAICLACAGGGLLYGKHPLVATALFAASALWFMVAYKNRARKW